MTQQPQQPPPPPTNAELASVLLATHAALGRMSREAFATLPDSILARLDAVVKRLVDSGRRPRRTGRDPLLERLRQAMAMEHPPEAPQAPESPKAST